MIVNLCGLKTLNLCGGKAYDVARECSGLLIPLKNDAVAVVIGTESCHVVAFLKVSLGDKLSGSGYLALYDSSLGLSCVVKSCNDLAVNNYGCSIVDIHLNSSLEVVTGGAVVSVVNAKTKGELAIGVELGALLVVASLYNCVYELADLDSTACGEEILILGDPVVVNLLILKSLELCCGLTYNVLLEDSSLLEPLLNGGAVVRSTVSSHVVLVTKLLLGEKVGEGNLIFDLVLVLNCVDLAGYDNALAVKNNGCNSSVDLCVGDVTEYDAKTKGILCITCGLCNNCYDTGDLHGAASGKKGVVGRDEVIVYKLGLKTCNLCGSHANNVVGESSGLDVPLLNNAVAVVVGAVSCHVVAFLKVSLGDKLSGSNYLAILNSSLGLSCVIKSCNDLAINKNGCSIVDVHLNGSLELVAGGTVVCAVNTKAKGDVTGGLEVHGLLVLASLNNCVYELADLDGTACCEECLILGDHVIVNFLVLKSLELSSGLADYVLLEDSSLLEPLLNDAVAVVIGTESSHVVLVAKLLLGVKKGEVDLVSDGVLVLYCIDLTINDNAVCIGNNSCDGSVKLLVGDVTEYDAKAKGVVLLNYRGNVVGVGLATCTLAIYKAVGVGSNVVRIGCTALALAVCKAVGVIRGLVAAKCKYKYEYKYENCCYSATDNADSLLAKGKLGSFSLLNGSLCGLFVEVLHFFAHLKFLLC